MALLAEASPARSIPAADSDRNYWIGMLTRVADPLLVALSERKLKSAMPVEVSGSNRAERQEYTYLEAIGRLLTGMSAWLESGEVTGREAQLRKHYSELARQSIQAAVDPASNDRMNFNHGSQPVVDAAFLALAMLRAPTELWAKLDSSTKRNVMEALRSTRVIRPGFSNWLLFSATIEAFFCFAGEPWDSMRVDYAIRQLDEWYKGDGAYGDGPAFHWDYYNSFVIHPMLLETIDVASKASDAWSAFHEPIVTRARRYAAIQERFIGPEGTFPPIGRSMSYRCGAFHLLAAMALRRQLPDPVTPAQVRCALTAVIRRMLEAPGTFDENGWLTIGFCGHQPALGERYISTGSLYLCSAAFLPLGLGVENPFWKNSPQPWTAKRMWGGENISPDHAI